MKAIETRYKGYRFRSRLEARWAVYFDAEGLTWEYERQGFDLGEVGAYLPDFWLSQVRMWAEVKPEAFNDNELEKAWRLFDHTGWPVLFLVGPPDFAAYQVTAYADEGGWYCSRDCAGSRRSYEDCFVSSHKGYPAREHRFYSNTGESDGESHLPTKTDQWDDIVSESVWAARAARFEYGETPRL